MRRGALNRRGAAVILLLLIAVAAIGATTLRRPLLQTAGRALVVNDAIEPADAIVLAVDAGAAGVLEAADLVNRGIATRVGIFADPPDPAEREFVRRGVPYEEDAARSARQLASLGVTSVEQIAGTVNGSEAEGPALRAWCARHQFHSVVVVSNADHSRRLRRVFQRSLGGDEVTVLVRSARYSTFDPETWWETRGGVRTGIVEFQKLLLDVARHPAS